MFLMEHNIPHPWCYRRDVPSGTWTSDTMLMMLSTKCS